MIKGISLSLISSMLFGCIYYLSVLLQPLEGEQIFGLRIWVTFPFVVFTLFLIKQQQTFIDFVKRIKREPHLILVLIFTSANMGIQMWIFLWAPNHGKAIDVSIGYLLMPLMMVLVGCLFYKERISKIKTLSIFFATVGVASQIILTGVFSWETALVCVGYPIYFAVRKKYEMLHLSSFVMEFIFLLPISAYFATQVDMVAIKQANPNIYFWLAMLGLISGISLSFYILASQLLPINLLGLLGYFEPLVMFFVSFLIGETLNKNTYILMGCLAISVGLLIFNSLATLRLRQTQ
ncbi:MAG: EamA family transporter RarD [Pasteurellaceae bacterium]|nr:EamA family transporter RarD [Pasteurellaceae bacterium]